MDIWEFFYKHETTTMIIAAVLMIIGIVAVATGIMLFVNANITRELSGLNPTYQFRTEFWNGCLVKINDIWMPCNSYFGKIK